MKPQIFEPNSDLTEFVQCYWTLEGDRQHTPVKNTIVPDGTMKLIFHYGDTYRHYAGNGESTVLPKCFLIGQLTRPYIVEPLGATGSFIVRFHPNGFLPFTTIPLKEMENKAVPLEKLFGNEGQKLGRKILSANGTKERIEIIEAFLTNRLTGRKNIDTIIKSTVESIVNTKGQFSVNQLSQKSNVNRRQLTRKLSTATGLSPKQLSKTIRIQAALKKMVTAEVTSLTDLAYESEYFDQAHFIKEFKEFTGLTPKEFYGDNLKMSLIFDRPR
jgi:AraC-like DNA-binding protein